MAISQGVSTPSLAPRRRKRATEKRIRILARKASGVNKNEAGIHHRESRDGRGKWGDVRESLGVRAGRTSSGVFVVKSNILGQMSIYRNFGRLNAASYRRPPFAPFVPPHLSTGTRASPPLFSFAFHPPQTKRPCVPLSPAPRGIRLSIFRGNCVDIGNESKEQITEEEGGGGERAERAPRGESELCATNQLECTCTIAWNTILLCSRGILESYPHPPSWSREHPRYGWSTAPSPPPVRWSLYFSVRSRLCQRAANGPTLIREC